ncbi:hypothetical protein QQF64_018514 [Cirrhinus molitorella]|uniref:P2X purinoceptor n=1 Tax=Cirrhinus molitorella TaxID=172907 RepID=A0ABR3LD23_9TELE
MITSIKSWFCEYSTPRILVVKYWKLGLIYRLYQLTLLLYIIWYVLVRRGHQDNDIVLSSVTTKVKGIALTNTTEFGEQIWDVADYIIPPQEDGSFFLMTNMIITPNQTQSKCAEGGGMAVQIQWDCDLDWGSCAPQYSFRRLDKKDPESSEPPVHNLRFAKYYKNSDGKDIRTLIKGYGIRFDVLVYGELFLQLYAHDLIETIKEMARDNKFSKMSGNSFDHLSTCSGVAGWYVLYVLFRARTPLWQKASATERRTLVVEEVRQQEEAVRCSKAVAQVKQGCWMRWEGVERKKLTWSELWDMESNRLSFIIRATYDVLPSPTNLQLWFGKDPSCPLCTTPATLIHILVGCKTSLSQGR